MAKRKEIDMGLVGALKGRGMTYKEIARTLGTTESVIENRLRELGLTRPSNQYGPEDPYTVKRWAKAMNF